LSIELLIIFDNGEDYAIERFYLFIYSFIRLYTDNSKSCGTIQMKFCILIDIGLA